MLHVTNTSTESWVWSKRVISMAWYMTEVTPLLTHWSYCGLALSRRYWIINTLRPRQNGRYFADDIFKCIFLNENAWISLQISLKFVPKVRISHIPALVQIMAWRRPGDKPFSEPVMVNLLTHICVARPQSVKCHRNMESKFPAITVLMMSSHL